MNDLFQQFQVVMEELRDATDVSRTTLRLELPEYNIGLETVIAEATAPGINSLKGSKSITDLRNTVKPVQYLAEHLDILVQDDCLTHEISPPQSLIEHYGVRAQMLGPVVEGNQLIGVISVHYNPGPRKWSEEDIGHLKVAMEKVQQLLKR